MTDASRTTVAVTLLADDPVARRIVLAWHLVPPELTGVQMLLRWSRLACVGMPDLEQRADTLMAHGVCRADRTVDPEALRVLQHLAAEMLRTPSRHRGPSRSSP